MINNPLVSVVVITYNSARTVLDTLDSIANQTYQNIELIISDDCSQDDTVSVVNTWVEENKNRFISVKILTVEKNTGLVKNCNRGRKAAKGEWIKGIAGDDMLMPDAIEEYIKFILANPQCQMCVAGVNVFSTENIPGALNKVLTILEKYEFNSCLICD